VSAPGDLVAELLNDLAPEVKMGQLLARTHLMGSSGSASLYPLSRRCRVLWR